MERSVGVGAGGVGVGAGVVTGGIGAGGVGGTGEAPTGLPLAIVVQSATAAGTIPLQVFVAVPEGLTVSCTLFGKCE